MKELLDLYKTNELEICEVEKKISLAIGDLQDKQKELENKNNEIKEKLLIAMEQNDTKKYENDFLTITYVAPITKNIVDSAKLKSQFIDVYNQCLKVSNVKASIRIKVK